VDVAVAIAKILEAARQRPGGGPDQRRGEAPRKATARNVSWKLASNICSGSNTRKPSPTAASRLRGLRSR